MDRFESKLLDRISDNSYTTDYTVNRILSKLMSLTYDIEQIKKKLDINQTNPYKIKVEATLDGKLIDEMYLPDPEEEVPYGSIVYTDKTVSAFINKVLHRDIDGNTFDDQPNNKPMYLPQYPYMFGTQSTVINNSYWVNVINYDNIKIYNHFQGTECYCLVINIITME